MNTDNRWQEPHIERKAKKQNSFISNVIGFFDLSFVGYLIIFGSFVTFGETTLWSWQMWCEVIGVTIGGMVLIQHGKNCR